MMIVWIADLSSEDFADQLTGHLACRDLLDFLIGQMDDCNRVLDKAMCRNAHRFYRFGGT